MAEYKTHPKSKFAAIDSVVIIDDVKSESTEKTIVPDEILSEKELPPHLWRSLGNENTTQTQSEKQRLYTIRKILAMHQRISAKYVAKRRASNKAQICLTLGFIGLFLFWFPIFSVAAIILGVWELNAISKRQSACRASLGLPVRRTQTGAGRSAILGRRMAQIGLVFGFIGIGLLLIRIVIGMNLI